MVVVFAYKLYTVCIAIEQHYRAQNIERYIPGDRKAAAIRLS